MENCFFLLYIELQFKYANFVMNSIKMWNNFESKLLNFILKQNMNRVKKKWVKFFRENFS
jgi:hypothetical protein